MKRIAVVIAFFCAPIFAYGQTPGATYRCVDENNRSTYSNVKEEMAGKRCVVVSKEVSVIPTEQRWSKAKATGDDFYMEKNQCISQGFGAPNQDNFAVVFATCMRGKGWQLVDVPIGGSP